MQEVVVTATKYPEIVVQGQRYDYTSDIVLAVVVHHLALHARS
jgi:hypothetical protein